LTPDIVAKGLLNPYRVSGSFAVCDSSPEQTMVELNGRGQQSITVMAQ